MHATGPYFVRLLGSYSDGTLTGVATGTSQPLFRPAFENLSIYIQAIGNPSVGTIVIEEAAWEPAVQKQYSGTWSPIQSIDMSTFPTDAQIAYHITGSCIQWVRVRISVDVTVATVVVMAVGN